MRKASLVVAFAAMTGIAFAGKAHFVGSPSIVVGNDTVSVSGKVAGLGNVPQIDVTVSGDAACINPGGQDPAAANKETFEAEGSFPVQNGKAYFNLDLEATFQPHCSPPMSVVWTNIHITVTADDGTFLIFP